NLLESELAYIAAEIYRILFAKIPSKKYPVFGYEYSDIKLQNAKQCPNM
ncbi:6706_t:CDS:1, partial [Gigaspora rosea]